MPRYKIELSYDGSNYFGWQRQPDVPSVQDTIESCLTKLRSNTATEVVGCGRTDTGVHAHHYVLHLDFDPISDFEQFGFKLNKMLPDDIAIQSVKVADDDFHARFNAIERTYRYFIHRKKQPFLVNQSWYFTQELDLGAMNKAANNMVGKKNFTSFSKLHTDVKTNICDVRSAKWFEQDDHRIYFEIRADRFLRNMVRATVGTLVDVGLGKIQPDDINSILEAKNRQAASVSVPPQGLYLWEICY